jgi:uncharacterized membrane protein (DUF485 family)
MNRSEAYKLTWELQNQEADRFWDRNNAFLLIHAGLLAVLTATSGAPFIERIVAIEGIVLAFLWLAISHRGKIYVYRWNKVLDRIENEVDEKAEELYPLYKMNEEAKLSDPEPMLPFRWAKGETTDLMRRGIYAVLAAWLIIFAHAWADSFCTLTGPIFHRLGLALCST